MNADLSLAGKHRGIVEDNNDPLRLGRLKVRVDAAYGGQPVDRLPWAWPCFAYGGMPQMAMFAVPEIGSGVWVEFQWKDGQPDATYPIWTGIWIAQGETPKEVKGPSEEAHYYKVFKTTSGHSLTFCDKPDEEYILLKSKSGHVIRLNDRPGKEFVLIVDKDGNFIKFSDNNIHRHAANNISDTAARIDHN